MLHSLYQLVVQLRDRVVSLVDYYRILELLQQIQAMLQQILDLADCDCRGRVVFRLGPIVEQTSPALPSGTSVPFHGEVDMAFEMTDSQQTTASPTFKDKKGNPVTPTSPPTWVTDNTDLLGLTPAADGLSCEVKAIGPLGTANVTVNAATPGGGISGTGEVTIKSGAATTITLDFAPPTEQP